MFYNTTYRFLLLLGVFSFLSACAATPTPPPTPTPPTLAEELVIHGWEGAMYKDILTDFTAEYGIKVRYESYITQEEGVKNIEDGKVYDIAFMYSDNVGLLIEQGLLAEIDLRNLPNIRNVPINFRDLVFDPGNKHSIPYSWGTAGLVYRADLFGREAKTWKDLWQGQDGHIGIWEEQRTLLGLALRSLGYSANTTNRAELEAAAEELIALKSRSLIMDQFDPWTCAGELASGRVSISLGWAYDGLEGRNLNDQIRYVLPEDGALLWVENLVIPASSPHKYSAELFLNFSMRPDISARYMAQTYYAIANEPARALLDPELANDPIIFPPNDTLKNAEVIMPLNAETRALYDEIWQRFLDAPGGYLDT